MIVNRLAWLFGGSVVLLISWYSYTYFFDSSMPHVQLVGLADSEYYAGDIPCVLASNKSGTMSILLDGNTLAPQCFVKGKSREYPFIIPTKTLQNGSHTIHITFTDTTFHHNVINVEQRFFVDNTPLNASFIRADDAYTIAQGHTLHVQFQTNKPIKKASAHALSNVYSCVPESKGSCIYECFIPVACEEQPNAYILSIEVNDHINNTIHLDHAFHVTEHPFRRQAVRIDQEKVKQEKEEGPGEKEFEALLARLSQDSPPTKLWRGTFCAPIDIQRITCEFGTIRTTQHKGRYAHKAIDAINNTPHCVVWAPQDGIVVMKDRFAASGNTVVLDHGCGILSMVFHLEDFADIKVGDTVAQGSPLGKQGQTGHATGVHLHWEHRVHNIPVDPMEWTKPTF
jgi:hypothetical protein